MNQRRVDDLPHTIRQLDDAPCFAQDRCIDHASFKNECAFGWTIRYRLQQRRPVVLLVGEALRSALERSDERDTEIARAA